MAIYEEKTGIEVVNNSNPSKKSIIGQAIVDYGGSTTKDETLYQRYHKLTKLVLDSKIDSKLLQLLAFKRELIQSSKGKI